MVQTFWDQEYRKAEFPRNLALVPPRYAHLRTCAYREVSIAGFAKKFAPFSDG